MSIFLFCKDPSDCRTEDFSVQMIIPVQGSEVMYLKVPITVLSLHEHLPNAGVLHCVLFYSPDLINGSAKSSIQ